MIYLCKYDPVSQTPLFTSGTIGQLLRNTGSDWLATSMLLILNSGILRASSYASSYNGFNDKLLLADSNGDFKFSEITGDSLNYYLNSRGFIVTVPGSEQIYITRTGSATKPLLDLKDLASGNQDFIKARNGSHDFFRVLNDGKIFSKYAIGTGERVAAWDSNGNLIPSSLSVGLPAGTVNNSILRYDSTDGLWKELTKILASYTSTKANLQIVQTAGTQYIEFEPSTTETKIFLRNMFNDFLFSLISTTSNTAKVFQLHQNGAEKFVLFQNGDITVNKLMSYSLTSNTLLKSNGNKEIVSITNAAGYLKNDGSGNFSYETPSTGSSLDNGTVKSSILIWNNTTNKWVEYTGIIINDDATYGCKIKDTSLAYSDSAGIDHVGIVKNNGGFSQSSSLKLITSESETTTFEAPRLRSADLAGTGIRPIGADSNGNHIEIDKTVIHVLQGSEINNISTTYVNTDLVFNLKANVVYELRIVLGFYTSTEQTMKYRIHATDTTGLIINGMEEKISQDTDARTCRITNLGGDTEHSYSMKYLSESSGYLNPLLLNLIVSSTSDKSIVFQFRMNMAGGEPPEFIRLKPNGYGILTRLN